MAEEIKETKIEPVQELTDSQKIDLLVKEVKALKTEVFINRVIFAIALLISLTYTYFQVSRLREILGTLLEMFLVS